MVSRAAQARVEAMTRLRERMSSMSPDERERMEKMIQRMERSGFVERRSDPEDERLSRVYLTERGRALQKPVQGV